MVIGNKIAKAASAASSVAVVMTSHAVFAAGISGANSTQASSGANAAAPTGSPTSLTGLFQTITNVIIYVVGAIAVIMLVVGGLQYVLSNGDSKRVEGAKNTILYSIIGIVVAVLGYAIVQFVFSSLSTGSPTG